jgi:hypothetical protein
MQSEQIPIPSISGGETMSDSASGPNPEETQAAESKEPLEAAASMQESDKPTQKPTVKPAAKPAAMAADKPAVIPDDTADLQAEVERLRAENTALASAKSPTIFWRDAASGLLIIIGVLMVSLAISAMWLNRTIMDENRWVDTMAPLAQNVAVQDYVAKSASDAIFANVNIQQYVADALGTSPLPPQLLLLTTPITNAIQNFVREAATKFTRSPQFAVAWEKTLRLTHKAFIVAISDKSTGVITKQGGTVTLDVSALITEIKAALSDKGLGFVNNINIPISKQQITIVDSPALAQLGYMIQLMNAMAWVLPLFAIVLLGGGIAVAAHRRKAVLWMGIGVILLTVIPVQAIYLGQIPFAKAALELAKMPSEAAQAAYSIIFRYLITANQIASVIGLVFVVGAIFAGPSKWATSLRGGFRHGLNNIGPDWDFGVVGQWIHEHESGMRTTGILLAVAMLLVTPTKSIWTIVWLVVFVIVWIVAVTFFGRPRPESALNAAPAEEPGDAAKSAS